MGGISTSHSASLSNHKASASKDFNLRNWQGLTDLLRVGKESITDPREYAEFRDLVFGYAHKGGDADYRKKIDAIVATFSHDKIKEHDSEKGAVAKKEDIPSSRHVPVQSVASSTPPVQEKTEHKPLPEETKHVIAIPQAPPLSTRSNIGIPTRRIQPRFDSVTRNTFIPKEVSTQLPVIPQPPISKQSIEREETETLQEIVDVPVSASESSRETEQEKIQKPKTVEEQRARITEIKRLVHTQMGNPVALMGAHSEVGKKYMSALLSALKATSAGSASEIEGAMQTLEDVTQTLLDDVGGHESGTRKSEASPAVTHTTITHRDAPKAIAPSVEVKREVEVPFDVPTETRHVPPVMNEDSVVPVAPEPKVLEIPDNEALAPEKEKEIVDVADEVPVKKSEPEEILLNKEEPIVLKENNRVPLRSYAASEIFASLNAENQNQSSDALQRKIPVSPEHNEQVVETPQTTSILGNDTHHPRTKHIYKNASDLNNETLEKIVGVDPKVVVTDQSELFSSKITEALQQLLHEWSIFSGSGLFGIGPGGSEHPLYIRLSLLSMGEVLAGRWEKSDPKLIKVIKQYVDAWRHEQGISYTIDETFEHYLRRVVQRILKRQEGV